MEKYIRLFYLLFFFLITQQTLSQNSKGQIEKKLHGGSIKQWVEINSMISLSNECDTGQILIFSKDELELKRKVCKNKRLTKPENLKWKIEKDVDGDWVLVLNNNEKYLIRFSFKDLSPNDNNNSRTECLWLTKYNFIDKNNPREHTFFREQF